MVSQPLTDLDIRKLLPETMVLTYPELKNAESIDDILGSQKQCVVLFLTENDHTGHWQGLFEDAKGIHFFDSYGMSPNGAFAWLNAEEERKLHQTREYLDALLRKAGRPVFYSTARLQSRDDDVATCGRHVCCRLLFKRMPLQEYVKMVRHNGDADAWVTQFTQTLLE